jgi:3-hydroxyisobutyrate dehydrogenase-like beta-hydroxyacid dehydrogenase
MKNRKLGFLGLGSMGFPMCYGLAKNGYTIVLPTYRKEIDQSMGFSPLAPDENTKSSLYNEMIKNGAIETSGITDLIIQSDIILISMPTSKQVEDIMLSKDGILEHIKAGSIIIDLTSSDPNSTIKLHDLLAKKNVDMLDAPVSGGNVKASDQTLTLMVGGKKSTFDLCRPIFDTIGDPNNVFHVGPIGAGDTIKCANNFLSACCMSATIEAIMVAAKAGIDPHTAIDVINVSGGRSHASTNKLPDLIFPGKNMGMVVRIMLKDINLFTECAKENNVPTFMSGLTYQLWNLPVAENNGNEDMLRYVELFEKFTGVKLVGID